MVAKTPLLRFLFLVLGLALTGIGALGAVLPILPTTPFLLLAAFCFLKSSDRLYTWLMEHPKFGPSISRIQEGKGIRLKVKVISTAVASLTIGSFIIWGSSNMHLRIFLSLLLLCKIAVMIRIPTDREYVGPDEEVAAAQRYRISAPKAFTAAIFASGMLQVLVQAGFALALGAWFVELMTGLVTVPTFAILLLAVRWLLILVNRYLSAAVSRGIRYRVRSDLFLALGETGADQVRSRGLGYYHELLNDRVEALDPLFSLYVPQLYIGILAPIAALGLMFMHDTVTGLLMLAVLPLSPLILGLMRTGFQKVGREYSKSAAELGSWYIESIRALPLLTLFQRIWQYSCRLGESSGNLRDRTIGLLRINQLALLLVELFFSLTLLGIATVLGLIRFSGGFIDPAFAFALPFLTIELIRPINLVGAFFFAGAAGRQSKKLIEAELNGLRQSVSAVDSDCSPDQIQADSGEADTSAPGLCVQDIHFAYPSCPEKKILAGISLELQPGRIIGVKGRSGSGKSTLAKIILGYYRPENGRVILDGRDITGLDQAERSALIGYLPQRPYLFGTSLAENIRMGNPAISDEQIIAACESAGLSDFVSRGLETPVGEDAGKVSGGERMRIGLARVLAAGCRYIVLDEPTAEIDTLTEAGIWKALRKTGAAVLLIAHRSVSLDQCDAVLSLDAEGVLA